MSAYEEEIYPWLSEEKQFILKAVQAKKKVLGICLGAQMIADVLGGKAYPHTHEEIGWWELRFNQNIEQTPLFDKLPKSIIAFQYHGDTLELPERRCCWLKVMELKIKHFYMVIEFWAYNFTQSLVKKNCRNLLHIMEMKL